MKSLILLSLIMTTICIDLNLGFQEVTISHRSRSHHQHKHHQGLVENTDQNTINNEEKKYLSDYQIHTNVTYGSKNVKQVVDTTSYISWVYSSHPQTQAPLVNGPTKAVSFQCNDGCLVSSTTEYDTKSHAARIGNTYEIASQSSVGFDHQSIKKFLFGLTYKITGQSSQLAPDAGNLGLAFGSDYIKYYKSLNEQVHPSGFAKVPTKDPKLNFVHELHNQNKHLLSAPSFALKIEQDLSLLSIGQQSKYFVEGPSQSYQNQNPQMWALALSSFKIGNQAFDLNQAHGTPATQTNKNSHEQLPQAIFDSTSRFFRVSADIQKGILDHFSVGAANPCVLDTVIKCPKRTKSQFQPIKFQFNQVTKHTVEVPVDDYVQEDTYGVYLNFIAHDTDFNPQQLGAAENQKVLLLSNAIFKNNYIVFDQKKNTIEISKSYKVSPTTKYFDQNSRIGIILAGLILTLFALVTLISILKTIDPNSIPVTQVQPQQALPEPTVVQARPQVVYYQQPVVMQSRVLPAAPFRR